MTNTPEQTLRDLLALGEALPYGDLQGRAVWMETTHPSPIFEAVPLTLTHQELERLLQFFAASKNALPAIRSLLDDRDRLMEALETAASRFDWYASLHAEKGTPDGDVKAERNRQFAADARAALSRLGEGK